MSKVVLGSDLYEPHFTFDQQQEKIKIKFEYGQNPISKEEAEQIINDKTQLSPDEGNLLEQRENGLYYGIVAPVEISQLHVANEGDDANPGTEDKPLRTVQKALEMIAEQKTQGLYTIFLKAGQTFETAPTNGVRLSLGQKSLQFRVFGDPKFGKPRDLWNVYMNCDVDLQRPTIIFDTFRRADGNIDWNAPWLSPESRLSFLGCIVRFRTTNGETTGGGLTFYVSELFFRGCDVYVEGIQGIGSANNIIFGGTNWYKHTSGVFWFIGDYAPQFWSALWGTAGQKQSNPTVGNGIEVTYRDTNYKEQLKYQLVAQAVVDTQNKNIFGFGVNWNIFE